MDIGDREKSLLLELKRRMDMPDLIHQELFDEQRAFVDDPSAQKAALCSRRAGKSYMCACYLLEVAMRNPGSVCVYIALTRKNAKRILWRELLNLDARYGIGMHFDNQDLVARLYNGSEILLTGAATQDDVEKLRGEKYKIVVIDESASFPSWLSYMIEEVIEPALLDEQGTLCMIGTPSAACSGHFYDVTTSESDYWSTHSWTMIDNPHIPHAKDWLERKITAKGWGQENPILQREWYGKWVRSMDSLVYRYNPIRNIFTELPHDVSFAASLGVDLGHSPDPCAFSVLLHTDEWPVAYVDKTYKKSELTPHKMALEIQRLQKEYAHYGGFESIVVDSGGLGKAIVAEFTERYGIPAEAAEKTNKNDFIELFNSDLLGGRIKFRENDPVVDEMKLLQWDEDAPKRREDGRFANHCSDGTLYVWRKSRHYMYEAEPSGPPPRGSQRWCEMEEQRMMEADEKFYCGDKSDDFWENLI